MTSRNYYAFLVSSRSDDRVAGLLPRRAADQGKVILEQRARNLRVVAEIGAAMGSRAGAAALAQHVEAVARARRSADPQQLRIALLEMASPAIHWANDIAWMDS